MENVGFYSLTLILTYLQEYEGTSLLLTKRSYAKQILPMFRRRDNHGLCVVGSKYRHKFQLSPIQDPTILLQRLNTRRLLQRRRQHKHKQQEQDQRKEQTIENDDTKTALAKNDDIQHIHNYKTSLLTAELAMLEWQENMQQFAKYENFKFPHHPPLEMLRFLDEPKKNGIELQKHNFLSSNTTTLLVSYPRSGNTLLRTLLERTCGIVTGSDTRPDRTLSKALAEAHNLVGEGVTHRTKTPWVKSHWPERTGCRPVVAHRVVLIVRNPYDAIDSYWNLNATNTHTHTVTDDVYWQFQDVFWDLTKNEIKVWCDFHRFWLQQHQINHLPLLLIRFEDLIASPATEVRRILEFVNDNQPLNDPFWDARIQHATASSSGTQESLGSYRPRTATTGLQSIGKSLRNNRYSEEIIQYIHETAANEAVSHENDNLLTKFGYSIEDQRFPENYVNQTQPSLIQESNRNNNNDNNNTATTYNETRGNATTITINKGDLIRAKDDPFGRLMRNWRLRNTENDTNPFPTVPR